MEMEREKEKIFRSQYKTNIEKKQHTGEFNYHDDDCMCAGWCNRDRSIWSCCGACVEDSYCSGEDKHYTHWNNGWITRKYYDGVKSHKELPDIKFSRDN
ncbi:hypothetical protein AKO1_010397 [Acrasis kona]|uniref:Uncharacterized protein n=1 Tax=Acrasis kona TaxID=1008807 RepID=A0AAW2YW67_9EUKA